MKFAFVTLETSASRQHIQDDRRDHRAKIEAWMRDAAQRGALVGGEAFETEAMGPVTVRHSATGETLVTEEPFAPGDETLGGYLLIEATDRDAAIALARTWPTEETIEIRPLWVAAD